MRDTYVILHGVNGGNWTPVSSLPTQALAYALSSLAKGTLPPVPCSPNGNQTEEAFRDRILIELRARELGLA